MITASAVHPFPSHVNAEFDLFINATGYEERASSLVRANCVSSQEYISFLFNEHKILAYDSNFKTMQAAAATMIDDPIAFCRHDLGTVARELSSKLGRAVRVAIDVSSMNRTMAATLLTALVSYREFIGALEIFYLPARFSEPTLTFSPIEQIGAVTPELSGFDAEPGLPIALVLGLGYEYGTAVGLIHQLEPQFTLCLRATGHDSRFEEAVRQANLDFDFSTYNVEISEYDLLDARAAYRHIENIVYSLMGNFRVVLVPMGPKMLASILVLIALRYFGKVAVWRVARPTQPADVPPDDIFLSATVDLALPSKSLGFDQLRNLMEGGGAHNSDSS